MNQREAILVGTKKATRLHDLLGTKEAITRTGGRVDVFDAALHQGSTLLFKDLDKLLGAYLNEEGVPGIIVTTKRNLSVQRFTAGHELGHFYMGHEPTVDGEEIFGPSSGLPSVEVQANAFAAEFLGPKWLLFHHGKQQGWGPSSITDPLVVYQLSLRIGLSYTATCYSLRTHDIITSSTSTALLGVPRKKIKRQILPASIEPANWFPDVWFLTEKDRGLRIEGQPEDMFVLSLQEKSSSGYLWDTATLEKEGFQIVHDERRKPSGEELVGGSVVHQITTGAAPKQEGSISLQQRRPWEARTAPAEQLNIDYDVSGKEKGLPRAQRRQFDAA